MATILTTILPVFGLIALGYICAKLGIMKAEASSGLGSFVFNIAIPALLFKTVATLPAGTGAPWSLWLVFFGGLAITWIATTVIARYIPTLNVDGGAEATMASCFGNIALLGAPLAISYLGAEASVPLGMIISVHAPILWTAATLHRELARNGTDLSLVALLRDLILNLSRNAIVVSLLAAIIWRYTGLGLTPVVDKMLTMLGDASVPTALFALGLSLAAYGLRGSWGASSFLIIMKMIFTPLVVLLLIRNFVPLPLIWAKTALLFAAVPTGANAFLFAQKNKAAVEPVSLAITIGTALSSLTIALLLYLMDRGLI